MRVWVLAVGQPYEKLGTGEGGMLATLALGGRDRRIPRACWPARLAR